MKKPVWFALAGLMILAAVPAIRFTPFSFAQDLLAPATSKEEVSAVYSHNRLRVSLPHKARNGAGRLTLEVLDPEDHLVGGVDRPIETIAGQPIRIEVPLTETLSAEDLIWHRLRYEFRYPNEQTAEISGITSISRILHRPELHVLGQQSYLSGAPAAVRLIVTESGSNTPVTSGSLRVELEAPARSPQSLYAGALNGQGTTRADFRFPAGIAGDVSLHYIADTELGEADYLQPVRIEEKSSILLTTEKPVYQPGQTIYVRALALDRASHQATGERKLTFEIEDGRGNKVFRKITQTDAWGVASAEFALADEVNLGTYHLRAVMEGEAQTQAQIALDVRRYVLPRFKVDLQLAAKEKHGYRPGDHVTGTVRGNYFFGKPVDHAEVTVTASGKDVTVFEAGTSAGTTDNDGAYRFDIALPDFFAGHPLVHGAAPVLIEATVKDNAGHSESHNEPITVSESPLLITAVPEGGSLARGLENQVFILAAYPDGTPARADLRVRGTGFADQNAATDQSGIAAIQVPGTATKIQVDAKDRDGNHASVPVSLEARAGDDQILLRADRALYHAGDRIRLEVLSTKPRGSAYIDVVKDGQTIATHDVEIAGGHAWLDLMATNAMAGTVDFNAYVFGRDARPIGDHRLVFVQPPDELRIDTEVSAPVYKPGDEARVGFRVTNSKGEGVQAALGVEAVDQAVFALAEKQPGFAKVFFYLEEEMMKPRYEIHSIGFPAAITSIAPEDAGPRDRAARVLFAATELTNANSRTANSGLAVPHTKYAQYSTRYVARLQSQITQIADRVELQISRDSTDCRQAAATIRPLVADLVDPWGNQLRLGEYGNGARYAIRSGGPDGRLYTYDDLILYLNQLVCMSPRSYPASQMVTVQAAASPVQTEVSTLGAIGGVPRVAGGGILGGVLGGLPQVLPLNGRNYSSVLAFSAGAAKVATWRAAPAQETHVRSWFPESLYIAPEIITDHDGRASITIPIADNITTWRMAMTASTKSGSLGGGTSSLKVFQDFFTEMDLPVTLTQGDEVSIPVAIYNYSGSRGSARLHLEPNDWFSLDGDAADKSVVVDSNRVGASQFTVEAKHIGKFKLTLRSELDGDAKRADIVIREIEVVPNGREQTIAFNGRAESEVHQSVNFPSTAIPEASTVLVRLYPGPMSQVVEGMDSLLRMPGGCFEQTSSSTWPNILALDYMKRTKKLVPEVGAKAEGFIASGYQRLLTFEVQGGGFSWFGQAPANKILTSYGLMEFSDMSRVHDVEPAVIQRTQQWLAGQQQPDGSWKADTQFINEGATNRFNSDTLRITAYIAWALETTGYKGPAVENARRFVESHLTSGPHPDAYTLAVVANFAVDSKDRTFADQAIHTLLDARTDDGDKTWWKAEETGVYATGASAIIETTGLAVQALLKQGSDAAVATKALNYIASKKDAAGAWGTTQATIMALRALVLASEKGSTDTKGTAEIVLNGKVAQRLNLTEENNDLLHEFVFHDVDGQPANTVEMRFAGEGAPSYQIAGRYFVPWNTMETNEPLSIDVRYDRTRLKQDEIATATATVRNNLPGTAKMIMVDLGIPPGFELLSEDLDAYREKTAGRKSGCLEKFSLTATQAILYFDSIAPREQLELSFRLRAKYPVRARTFESRVYEYYAPEVNAIAQPMQLEIEKR